MIFADKKTTKRTSKKNILLGALLVAAIMLLPIFVTKEIVAKKSIPGTITGVVAGNGSGSIILSQAGYADVDITNIKYIGTRSSTITLTATPRNEGSEFSGWSGDVGACAGTKDPCTFTMGTGKTVIATFSHPSAHYDIERPDTSYTEEGVTVEFNESLPSLPHTATGINIATSLVAQDTLLGLDEAVEGVIKTHTIMATNQLDELVTSGFSATVTFGYPAANDSDEAKYGAAYWNGTEWSTEGISEVSVNTVANTITFNTTHFSDFSLIADARTITDATDGTDGTDGTGGVVANNGSLPVSGDEFLTVFNLILVFALLASIACLVIYRYENKKKRPVNTFVAEVPRSEKKVSTTKKSHKTKK